MRLFIRSDGDLKELNGSVWTQLQLTELFKKLQSDPSNKLLHLPIVVATRKRIEYEWRVFLVDGKVSSGSMYRHFGDLNCSRSVPDAVRIFAEQVAKIWTPMPVFVMDLALHDAKLYVLELNGFNSCGFYSSDVPKIIVDIDAFACRQLPL